MVLAMAAAGAGMANAAPAQPPTQNAASVQSEVVARGDGWILVGSGHKVAGNLTEGAAATPDSVTHCGWITCSIYLSRAQTLNSYYYVLGMGGAPLANLVRLCGYADFAGPFAAVGCAAVVAAGGIFLWNAISGAAQTGGCLRVRFPIPFGFYNDHSQWCHDN